MEPVSRPSFNALKKVYPQYHDHDNLYSRITRVAAKMRDRESEIYRMEASATRPNPFYVTGREFFIVQAQAGKGSFSSVFFAVKIAIDTGETKNMVIKVSKMPFFPEKERLTLLSPNSKVSDQIDHFKGTYKIHSLEEYIAIFDASSCDFCHIDYKKLTNPVTFAVKQLLSVVGGIASFHRSNMVLRDLKGANCLANVRELPGMEPEARPGKVTDFGLVRELSPGGGKHSTCGTPTYMAPYIWENILCQKYRIIENKRVDEGGVQGKASDIFSLGRTIQYDMILPLLTQVAEKHKILEVRPLIALKINRRVIKEKLSDETLLVYENLEKGYVFHVGVDESGNDVLAIFNNEEEVYQKTLKAIELVASFLPNREVVLLERLAELARDLQVTQKEALLGILSVEEENKGDELVRGVEKRLREVLSPSRLLLRSLSFSATPEKRGRESNHSMETRQMKRRRTLNNL